MKTDRNRFPTLRHEYSCQNTKSGLAWLRKIKDASRHGHACTNGRGHSSEASAAPDNKASSNPFININRDDGVVFKVQDNVPIAAYVDALTNSLNPHSVVSASRISNGRAAIYLKTRDDVD